MNRLTIYLLGTALMLSCNIERKPVSSLKGNTTKEITVSQLIKHYSDAILDQDGKSFTYQKTITREAGISEKAKSCILDQLKNYTQFFSNLPDYSGDPYNNNGKIICPINCGQADIKEKISTGLSGVVDDCIEEFPPQEEANAEAVSCDEVNTPDAYCYCEINGNTHSIKKSACDDPLIYQRSIESYNNPGPQPLEEKEEGGSGSNTNSFDRYFFFNFEEAKCVVHDFGEDPVSSGSVRFSWEEELEIESKMSDYVGTRRKVPCTVICPDNTQKKTDVYAIITGVRFISDGGTKYTSHSTNHTLDDSHNPYFDGDACANNNGGGGNDNPTTGGGTDDPPVDGGGGGGDTPCHAMTSQGFQDYDGSIEQRGKGESCDGTPIDGSANGANGLIFNCVRHSDGQAKWVCVNP